MWGGEEVDEPPDAETVLKDVCVWHFSGSWDTSPWIFLAAPDAGAVREQAVEWFQDVRNPEIPDNNWIWFQVIVETFLRGLGAAIERCGA